MNTKKITFIEEGRLSDNEMSNCFGGEVKKPIYSGECTSTGPICPMVGGSGTLTIIRDCHHNLFVCSDVMKVCNNPSDLAYCAGDCDKAVVRPA